MDMEADTDSHAIIRCLADLLKCRPEVLRHSVSQTDEGTLEITLDIFEDDSDLLQEVIDRICTLIEARPAHDRALSFAVVTSYEEHDFPTLTTVHVEGDFVVVRTESQIDSGATYRHRLRAFP